MLIAGNWKMHTDPASARSLTHDVIREVGDPGPVTVVLCPPFVNLSAVHEAIGGSPIALGAQNVHAADAGAYTGEISASMLRAVGCLYVILGHSERRQLFGETDEGVRTKIEQVHRYGLIPIVCVGETLRERKAGRAEEVVGLQLADGLAGISCEDPDRLVIAYEPVWAIGTGETATPVQAQEMHATIRERLIGQFGASIGHRIHVLYGGSVKPGNAAELFRQKDVDGGLIGGASLRGTDFAEIVRAGS